MRLNASPDSPVVGFVGLGAMGAALASRLQQTRPIVAYDTDPARIDRLTAAGAVAASSLADVAARCDVVLLCLPNSSIVRDVVLGDGGLAPHLRPGSVVVDMSSGDPPVTRSLAEALAPRDVTVVDAPVSGGPQAAAAGTIAIMVGADAATYRRVAHVLGSISANVVHVGDVGAGQTLKAINNMLAASHRLLAFEALAIAKAHGLDLDVCVDVLNRSSGRSYATEVTLPRHILDIPLEQHFALHLMVKDVAIARGLSGDVLDSVALSKETARILERYAAEARPDADINELIELYEEAISAPIARAHG